MVNNEADEWNNKGTALGNLGKYEEAIECFDKAIEINPNYAYAWRNKGNALYNLKKYDEAIGTYQNPSKTVGNFFSPPYVK